MTETTRVKTTCPRDCYDACGMVGVFEDGTLSRVMGDRDHHVSRGTLCGKCAIVYNGVWRDPEARLSTPLMRTGPKGSGAYAPVSWEVACDLVAARLRPLMADGPAHRVAHAHYTGTVGLIAGWFPLRFFQAIGATEIDPDTVCNKAGHAALGLTLGDSLDGFDPEQAAEAATILVWGANPGHTAPHMHKDWLRETPARVIAIDPIAHRTARERADLHLAPRPGTDAALAFGMMHVAWRDGLLDRAFIDAHVLGFDEILPAIEAATPAATEAATGVPAAQVETVARAYAEGPSLLWMGQGMQRTARGGNAFRALAALAAVTGNIGRPGAGLCYMNGPGTRGIDMDRVVRPDLDAGTASVSHMDLAAHLADADKTAAFFAWNCNPLASSPDQNALRAALSREDLFTVVTDLFHTDTAAYADLILPAASFLEFDDVVAPYFHHTLSAQAKLVDPPGAALPNQEVFRRIARALGLNAPALYEEDAPILEDLVAMTGYAGGFAGLKAAGTVRLHDRPRTQFPGLAFPTPSGRIEIASEAAVVQGMPRVPEPHADAPPGGGRLRILSPASIWQMNASYANDPGIRKRLGRNAVILHPDEAAARGLKAGDRVLLSNEAGALALEVAVDAMAQPGFGIVYKGRWPGFEAEAANVNVLHAAQKSDVAEATSVHNLEVDLTRLPEAAE
jgi:anaerobic selenocysteine-containing dehydrogenase